jgi:hypothetical protein
MIHIERVDGSVCSIYLDSYAWFSMLWIATASAKTKEQSKAKH